MTNLSYIFIFLVFSLTAGCEDKKQFGHLIVEAIDDDTFEIYKTSGSDLSAINSEQIGRYNRKIKLEAGYYFILADCSHKEIVIRPDETIKVITQKVSFHPPRPIEEQDIFSIQCTQYEKMGFRQHLRKTLDLQLFTGKHSILTGMKSTFFDFDESKYTEPSVHPFKLGAISVIGPNQDIEESPFYISPTGGSLAVTQSQKFNHWQFLLPGSYVVTLNGSKRQVELFAGESIIMESALLSVTTPEAVDLDIITKVRGKPQEYTINGEHSLSLNKTYPMLAGNITFNLVGSDIEKIVSLNANQLTNIPLKSVEIELGCSPWDWTCLGSKEVLLFKKDQYYPFIKNYTDIPILYTEDEVYVSLLGSHGIRYKLPEKEYHILKAGFLKLVPIPTHKAQVITDLARLEPLEKEFSGFTIDIMPEKPTTLTLIEGQYELVRYNTYGSSDGERNYYKAKVFVNAGVINEANFPFFVSKRKYQKLIQDYRLRVSQEESTKGLSDKSEWEERNL